MASNLLSEERSNLGGILRTISSLPELLACDGFGSSNQAHFAGYKQSAKNLSGFIDLLGFLANHEMDRCRGTDGWLSQLVPRGEIVS